MIIARIVYPLKVLGPGNRIGIWVCGCKRGCKNCANPELWPLDEKRNIPMTNLKLILKKLIDENQVDGVTISGGEPFLQVSELSQLVDFLKDYTDDILIFTGYLKKTLLKRKKLADENRFILDNIAVLVEGAYIDELNNGHPLKGSDNQRLIFRDDLVRQKYEEYINQRIGEREVQCFDTSDGMICAGIHKKKFNAQFGVGKDNNG